MATKTHFTAVLEVHRVDIEPEGKDYSTVIPEKRTTAEVTKIVCRADNLEKLRAKLAAYTDLIEN
jgi:hypothetical protein